MLDTATLTIDPAEAGHGGSWADESISCFGLHLRILITTSSPHVALLSGVIRAQYYIPDEFASRFWLSCRQGALGREASMLRCNFKQLVTCNNDDRKHTTDAEKLVYSDTAK